MKAIICDLDGTLADCQHRRHHLPNYDAFHSESVNDPIVDAVRECVERMTYMTYKDDIALVFCTGRNEAYRMMTETWLASHGFRHYEGLLMRADGDFRQDYIIKEEMLHTIQRMGYEILFTLDDRQQVVDMWRRNGIPCFQVAPSFEEHHYPPGDLLLMVGPSCAGKTWALENNFELQEIENSGVIVSSDSLRQQLCGDFRDQSNNTQVFDALHHLVRVRITHGLNTIVDATNIKNKDRRAITSQVPPDTKIMYFVIDRPLPEKIRDAGWRKDVIVKGKSLIEYHHTVFQANLKDILAGDNDPRVTVHDIRKV